MGIAFTLQVFGVIFSAAAPLLFAAPRLPYIKEYVRPSAFERGWYSLVVNGKLNHTDDTFNKVLGFIIGHSTEEGHFADTVANDLGIDPSEIVSETDVPAVEEIRILTKPPDWREQVLLCYDENTEGPPGEPRVTRNHGFEIPNMETSGEDWRWFGPLSGFEHNALRYTNSKIDRWTNYGAIALSVGVIFQILVIAIS